MMTVRTGALLTPVCDTQQQETQDEEIINRGKVRRVRLNQRFQMIPLLRYRILLRLLLQELEGEREGSGH
jgi:hypothetical protein